MNNASENGFMKALKFILYPFVALFMLFWEPSKFLSKKAYGGKWQSIIVSCLVGFALSCLAAVSAADFGLAHHLSFVWWGLGSIVGFWLTGGIVWPLAYLFVFKPLWDLGEKFLDLTRKIAKNAAKPAFKGLVSLACKFPGASALWASVLETPPAEGVKRRKRWAFGALTGVVAIATLALGALVAYTSCNYLIALVPTVIFDFHVNQALAGLLALTATTLVLVPLYQVLDEAEEGYVMTVLSGAATWAIVTKTALLAGFAGAALYAAAAGIALAAFVYVIPGIIALASGGLAEAVLRGWKNLLEAVYDDEENKDFRKFYHNVMNIVVALLSGAVAYYVAGLVNLPSVLMWVAVGVSVLYCYVEGLREIINKSAGNPLLGVVLSTATGVGAWFALPGLVGIAGGWLAAACVGVTFATGLIAYPFFYLIVRALTSWAAAPVGTMLDSLRNSAVAAFLKLRKAVRDIQRSAFDDSTPYSGMFGHVLNISVIGVAIWQALPLAMGYLSFGFWLNSALAVFVGINLFMLLGKLFYKWGAEALACGGGFVALLSSAHWAYGASGGNVVATVTVALTAASIVGGFVAPAVYLVIRPLANLVLTAWLAPILNGVFDFMWKVYEGFWRQFASVYRIALSIVKPIAMFFYRIIAPIVVAIVAVLGPISRAVASVWQSIAGMFGGKK
ncbi:hypothetical protein BH11CYA1_BH11CYA1_15390 [soil metagenome]